MKTVVIKPKKPDFRHAGELPARFDRFDVRRTPTPGTEVEVDLRDCEFVRPPAALWCAVFLTLSAAHGVRCRLLVPRDLSVCVFLKSIGLFAVLKDCRVEVDDRGVGASNDLRTVLPITRFATPADATRVTNAAFAALQRSHKGAVNLTSVVTELFGELTMNAVQHSESPVGAFACVRLFETKPRFTCTVADGGIGVYEHLRRNKALQARVNYDWDALELAVRERVSGTGDPHRGIGLYGVSEDVRRPGRSLLLHSGLGSLEINENMELAARRTRLFPGTLAYLSVPVS